VIYDNTDQIRWVKVALDWFVSRIAAIRCIKDRTQSYPALDEAADLMWGALGEMCVSFKLDVFKEESEWRVVEFVPKKESLNDVDNLKFRSKAGILIPYRVFPTERVAMFLRSEGFLGVWVTSSMIPLNAALQ